MSPSFLIIQTAFLGDVILSTAIAEKLHEKFPDSSIDLLVRKGNESLFANHPFLRNVITWNKKNQKYRNLISTLKTIRSNRYDHVINLQRFAASGFLTAFSKAGKTTGFNKNPFSFLFSTKVKHEVAPGIHETNRNQKLISQLTGDTPVRPKLYPGKEHFDSVDRLKSVSYVTLSPASVWYTKTFPKYKWIELIQQLKPAENFHVYLLGAPNESEYCEYIRTIAGSTHITNLAGKLSVLESAALMKDAKMNYVNDSAPLHIASSMNAPVTAFYCSTIPDFGFGPLSDVSKIVQTEILLDCRPCGLHGYKECPLIHFRCGHTIAIGEQLMP